MPYTNAEHLRDWLPADDGAPLVRCEYTTPDGDRCAEDATEQRAWRYDFCHEHAEQYDAMAEVADDIIIPEAQS